MRQVPRCLSGARCRFPALAAQPGAGHRLASLRTRWKGNGETPSLHGTVIQPEELWSCCTCRACEEVCPALVQHPRLIIDLRRHLVDQGQVDEGIQDALMNFQRYGNSFGQSPRKRPDWAKPLDFKLKDARKEEVEYLWFVGDYASYDQRAQEVTRAIAKVLRRAGVDVGLLFEKEQNAGNDVRRIGEEGLFSMLRDKNSKELGRRNSASCSPPTRTPTTPSNSTRPPPPTLTRRERTWQNPSSIIRSSSTSCSGKGL